MSTKNVSYRVDHEMYEAIKKRSDELGFPTPSDYQKSLVRYDLLIGKPHTATGDLHTQSVEQQSNFDRTLAAAYIAGETSGGTYFERIFKKIIEEMGKDQMTTPSQMAQKVHSMLRSTQPPHKAENNAANEKYASR